MAYARMNPDDEPETPEWRDYKAATRKIDERVDKACKAAGHDKVYVDYSAYESDERDVPIDNLDEVAVPGKVVLVGFADDFFGGKESKNYQSPILNNPTWLEACVHANKMIDVTGDEHHCFLEGFHRKKTMDSKVSEAVGQEVEVWEFSMGS